MKNNKTITFFYIILMIFCVFCAFFNKKYDNFYIFFKNYDNLGFCYICKNTTLYNKNLSTKITKCGEYDLLYFDKYIDNIEPEYKQVILKNSNEILCKIISGLNARLIKTDTTNGIKTSYYYSPFFCKSVLCDGQKVNIQLVFYMDSITIGYPIIYLGY